MSLRTGEGVYGFESTARSCLTLTGGLLLQARSGMDEKRAGRDLRKSGVRFLLPKKRKL